MGTAIKHPVPDGINAIAVPILEQWVSKGCEHRCCSLKLCN